MTAQFPDIIHYRGERRSLFTNPLENYFAKHPPRPDWPANCTACWRGYIATWLIEESRLYLVRVENEESFATGDLQGGPTMFTQFSELTEIVSLSAVFPEADGAVFAEWFSGELRLPEGEMLQYIHGGYCSVFERDVVIEVRDGYIVSERVDEPPPEWVTDVRRRQAEWQRMHEECEAEQSRCDRMRTLLIETLPRRWPKECSVDCDTFAAINGPSDLATYFNDTYEVMDQLEPLLDRDVDLRLISRDLAAEHWEYLEDLTLEDDPRRLAYVERFLLPKDNDQEDDGDENLYFISGLGRTIDREAAIVCLADDMLAVLLACRQILSESPDRDSHQA